MPKPWREILDSCAKLEKDWDSYGADPLSPEAIARARRIMEGLEAIGHAAHFWPVPLIEGGIGLEILGTPDEEKWADLEIRASGEIIASLAVEGLQGGEPESWACTESEAVEVCGRLLRELGLV